MIGNPLVSVLMTTYNTVTYLPESVNSVLRQTYRNLEIIIVDDGSTDGTHEYLQTLSDPRIQTYTLEHNQHISCATNFGMSKITGDYLAIIDSDDIWYDCKIEQQIAYLSEHPEHKACFNWVTVIDENGDIADNTLPQISKLFQASNRTQEEWLTHFFFIGNCLNNPSSIVETSVIPTIGLHNPLYVQGHDFDWWIRFTKHYSFGIIEEPLIYYRRFIQAEHTNTSSTSEVTETRYYNECMQMRYHYFDDLDDDLFERSFHSHFRDSSSHSRLELACEKVFLTCKNFDHTEPYCALGLLKIEELLLQEDTRTLLYEKYNLSPKDFYQLTSHHIYNDPTLQSKITGQAQHIQRCENQLQDLILCKEQLNEEIRALRSQAESLSRQNQSLHHEIIAINNTKLRKLSHMINAIRNHFRRT